MASKLPQKLFTLNLPKLVVHLIAGYHITVEHKKTTVSSKSSPLALLGLAPKHALALVKSFPPVAMPYQDHPPWGPELHWGRVHYLLTEAHDPIHLKVGDTHLQVINGRHRLLAAWLDSKSTIQAYVEGYTDNPVIQVILNPLLC